MDAPHKADVTKLGVIEAGKDPSPGLPYLLFMVHQSCWDLATPHCSEWPLTREAFLESCRERKFL